MLVIYILALVGWLASAITALVAMRKDRLDVSGIALVTMWAAWAVILIVGALL